MKNNKKTYLKLLWDIPKRYKFLLALISLLSMASAAASVTFAVACKEVVDAAVRQDKNGFITSCVMAVLVVVLLLIFTALSKFLNGFAESSLERMFRLRFLNKCMQKKYKDLSAYHSSELINRMSTDISVVTESLTGICPDALYLLTQLVYASVLLLIYVKQFMLLVVPIGIVIFTAALFLRRVLKENHSRVRSADGEVKSYSQENFSSISVIKAFGRLKKVENRAENLMNEYRKAKIKQTVLSSLVGVCFALLMWGSYIAAFIFCAIGILEQVFTYGTLVAVQQLINKVQTPFTGLSGIISRVAAMESSAERIYEIESLPSDPVCDEVCSKDFGSLEIKDLSFAYELGKSILDSFDMNVEKGDFACIVGPSGIGKSTVLKLILGLYDDYTGKIVIKDTNGAELKNKKGIFAYVPQGNYLFSGTVKENIALFSDEKDENSIIKAAKVACAHDFIMQLPNGYDTVIGERGMGLSEGQVQRIAVARAVLSGYPVLLLDESTSALDENIEAAMLKNLKELNEVTVITITHRRAALDICNKIVEIKQIS